MKAPPRFTIRRREIDSVYLSEPYYSIYRVSHYGGDKNSMKKNAEKTRGEGRCDVLVGVVANHLTSVKVERNNSTVIVSDIVLLNC